MNPSQLLAYFDRICDAPHAVWRLRRFVLDLAVRGKLIEQDPRDEPASELLKRIQAEKARLVKEGKINLEKPPAPASPNDLAFALRPKWQAVRISQILVELQTGPFGSSLHQSDYQKGGIPVINPASIKNERLVPIDRMAVGPATLKRLATFKLRAGDIVMARRGEMGRCAVVTKLEEGWLCGTGSLILRLPSCVCGRFFVLLIGSPFVREYLGGSAVGATMQNLNQSILLNLIVGLPPLAEQHRIVAKVDELMALCDRLEAARAERESRRDRLASASLHHLNNGANAEAIRNHARFYLSHLPRLTTRPEHVPPFRQTILTLAVRGELIPQDRADESASELLKRIQAEKTRLTEEGLLRKEKPLPPVADDEAPFAIPTSWIWARIGTVSLLTDYGTSVKSDHAESGVPVLKMGDIQGGKVVLGGQKKVPRKIEELPQLFLKRFDLLYNRTNSAELVGKTGIYMGEEDAYTFASYLIRIRFLNNLTSPIYANLAMNAPYFRATQIIPELQQQCGQANVNGSKLRNMLIPLPPPAEQKRIVSKVDELMALCDRLERQLIEADAKCSGLLEAVLHQALNDTVGSVSRTNPLTLTLDSPLSRIPAHQ